MASPKQHIEAIRRDTFSIGGKPNPLREFLHQAVKHLSAELYAKDVHFLMELIQNAEDNEYLEGVKPSLEFIITSKDITKTGASATLLIFNNEKGFSAKNIESICGVGVSTKKGNRKSGYIGEKGIGFKSVFLITAQPYIFSNGYQIRFNEEPCPHCSLGYMVPEWVEENPTLSDIHQLYGTGTALPTTTIVLPLKADKVKPVKQQLSSMHPEVLLFLTKIKQLSVKECNEDPCVNTVSAISISKETNYVTRKNMDAESYTLFLSTEENCSTFEKECGYYMWKQKFPVGKNNKVERRMEVEEWVITLAFPHGQRLHRGMSSPGVYAFLPTEMVTNFPFIIQADFLLASSRESILLDDKWNQGILDCVPTAFVNAFKSLVKRTENDAPVSSLPPMFGFLPVNNCSFPELDAVRESIREKLLEEDIVPCESYTDQRFFHKPREVGRLMPDFWNILKKAKKQGVSLGSLSSHGMYILSCSFDATKYDHILNFMGVKYVDVGWYAKCIQSSNLVLGVSEDVYMELLLFLAENWLSHFQNSTVKDIPLLKYVSLGDYVSLCSISEAHWNTDRNVLISHESRHISWLIDWNKEFGCLGDRFFMPKSMQEAIQIQGCYEKETVLKWLKESAKVRVVGVADYANLLYHSLSGRKLVISFAHFLFHSLKKNYMSEGDVKYLAGIMPLVNNYGYVTNRNKGVLVPADGSKWMGFVGSNPWRDEGYVELGEEYLHSGIFAGNCTPKNRLLNFLKAYVGATDLPDLSPPNAAISTVASPLTKPNAFLLLDWIRSMKNIHMPERFLRSIKEGSWLKISLSGSPGYRAPSESFLLSSSCGTLLQNGSVFVDIPLIDQEFYGASQIENYKQELKTIGVMFEYEEACQFIGKHLMSLAASSNLTRGNVLSILKFVKFLREKFQPLDKFIDTINKAKWLKTSLGYRSPVGSVLYDQEWKAASGISDIPFVDKDYYGGEILYYKMELQLLGVVVGFNGSYQLVADCLKSSFFLSDLTAEAVHLMMECMRHSESADKMVKALKDLCFLKTDFGFKSPAESFLFNPEWGSLLQIFDCFPLVDQDFYGSSILLYVKELKQLGVKVDFEDAAKGFATVFRNKSSSMSKKNVLSFLACVRRLENTSHTFPSDFKKCIREVKWLRTRLADYRSPNECILFGPDWESIAPITLLPFIDSDNFYGKGIHEYKNELESMGVVIDFKDGVKFITSALCLPQDPCVITPANVLSLLECIRIMQKEHKGSLPESFSNKVSKKWIKTHAGYRSPDQSLLFDAKWGSFFQRTDGPFIDEEFYGPKMVTYREELNTIGVIVDEAKGGELLSSYLYDSAHSDYTTIVKIYHYLREMKWEPTNEAAKRIWIPSGTDHGRWVSPKECVLHDKNDLFGLQLYVLEKHYDKKLLSFFSSALEVKSNPLVEDYCNLWKDWESSGGQLSHSDCCIFWGYVTKHWTKKTVLDSLEKLPVESGLEGTFLFDKRDVFIADDLQLKDLFTQSSPQPIFVWYPQPSIPSLPRTELLETYRKIGVRNISEAVEKEALSIVDGVELKQVNPKEDFIGKELVKLILGFLAGPIKMEVEKRHEAVKRLINLTVLETAEPISVGYSLKMSSGQVVKVNASRMIRWDRENSKLFMQKMDKAGGYRNRIEYATYFSEVISEGVLWEHEDHIHGLSELIKLAFTVEFNEEAVEFLMKNKNLQIFGEDEEFLLSAFASE